LRSYTLLQERLEIFSQVFSSISSMYSATVYLLPQSMQRRLTERHPKSSSTSPPQSLHFNPLSICRFPYDSDPNYFILFHPFFKMPVPGITEQETHTSAGTAFFLILASLRGIPNFFGTAETGWTHPRAKSMVDSGVIIYLIRGRLLPESFEKAYGKAQ
jgi:hypothetical protein